MAADVDLKRVTKSYGSFKAVDDLSLHIAKGSFVSLLGSSGAGKSTVLKMIGGFEFPDFGSISIGGEDVTHVPPYRRNVNTVFQNYALFPHMSAAENVAYGIRRGIGRAERDRRVREALESVELLHLAQRRPNELSGGQQQRIALARALVRRPAVLLLDEPLGALDRKLRQQMQVELKVLQKELGLTFIFVTHDQEEALAMSDSIVVMRDGRIEQQGDPFELYDKPSSAFVADFIGKQNFIVGSRIGSSATIQAGEGVVLQAGRVVPGIAPNATVLGAVRPENVLLSPVEPIASVNRVAVRLTAVVMLGDMLEHVLTLRHGTEFLCRVPRSRGEEFATGSAIWAHWSPDSFCLLPFEPIGRTRARPGHAWDGVA